GAGSHGAPRRRDGDLELAIERLADGEVSPFFHDIAQVGDTIELRGRLGGHFLWPGPSNKSVLLIGAGSGVVPLIAMIRYRKASGADVQWVISAYVLIVIRERETGPMRAEAP